MDERTFQAFARRAKQLQGDYGAGYRRGLHRHYHGERFGEPGEHEVWVRMGLDDDPREEMGRGYRDGLEGREPEPRPGRPPGRIATASVSFRLTPERAEKLRALGGVEWLNAALDRARAPKKVA